MSVIYAQLGESAIVTYELIRRDLFAEKKVTKELLGKLAMDIVGATGYEGEYVIKLWRTIDEDPFRQQNRIDVCADIAPVKHGHWIPCSERLPEDSDYHDLWETPDGAVLWCKATGEIGVGWYYETTKNWSDLWDNGVKDVIAWMPLQEPYKEEQDG